MPNFDGGHYFLTALLPIGRARRRSTDDGTRSPAHLVREALSVLPKARQTPSSDETGHEHGLNIPVRAKPSHPFRALRGHRRRHLQRPRVRERAPGGGGPRPARPDGFTARATSSPRPTSCSSADFDAASGDDSELRAYLAELWDVMEPELRSVLRHCHGFARGAGCGRVRELRDPGADRDHDALQRLLGRRGALPAEAGREAGGRCRSRSRSPGVRSLGVGALVAARVPRLRREDAFRGRAVAGGGREGAVRARGRALGPARLVGASSDRHGRQARARQKGSCSRSAIVVARDRSTSPSKRPLALAGRSTRCSASRTASLALLAAIVVIGLALAAVVLLRLRFVVRRSTVPFPAAPDSTCPRS